MNNEESAMTIVTVENDVDDDNDDRISEEEETVPQLSLKVESLPPLLLPPQ